MVAVRQDRKMPPRRGLNLVWVVVLQRCRASGAISYPPGLARLVSRMV
jgi:hypothetical protein